MTELIKTIDKLATKEGSCLLEERHQLHIPNEVYGGNFDDCYFGGKQDGKIELARQLKQIIKDNNYE